MSRQILLQRHNSLRLSRMFQRQFQTFPTGETFPGDAGSKACLLDRGERRSGASFPLESYRTILETKKSAAPRLDAALL